ncbi:MAG: hypothetical protein HZA77_12425 [Candidatus Schekmanbacteria bacterium]|nr:hypothetical protein [Candidatus Schekmanbacteria bacterium]
MKIDDSTFRKITFAGHVSIVLALWGMAVFIIVFLLNGYFWASEWNDPSAPFARVIAILIIPVFILLAGVGGTLFFGITLAKDRPNDKFNDKLKDKPKDKPMNKIEEMNQ